MKEELYNDLIRKFLEGNATAHEKEMLSNWLKEDPSRDEIFYLHVAQRERESPQYLPEVDEQFRRYEEFLQKGRMEQRGGTGVNAPVASRRINYQWLVAASIVLLITCYYLISVPFSYNTYAAGEGRIRPVKLADGSQVTLNSNSTIKVRRNFAGKDTREVWITGEAFFEVATTRDRKNFIVHTDNCDVEVLGTKFNVNNRRGKTEVVLVEGKVKLHKSDREPVIMVPGEQVSMSDSQGYFQKKVVELDKYKSWKNEMLVFDNTPLSEVGQIIEDFYDVKVVINDSVLAKREFTGTLPNDDLEMILLALRTAYNIDIEREENLIVLKAN